MRAFLLAGAMILLSAAAQADTISYTSQVPPTGYDAYGGYGFQVLTPGFDGSLGTLDSVSMTVAGSVQDTILSLSGDTVPFAAIFDNVGSISGFGFNQSGVMSQNSGSATTFLASNAFAVNATVSTSQDLTDYASNTVIGTTYSFYSTVTNAATGQAVAYDSDNALFSGTVTETFSYTAVPEPASVAVLTFGLLAVAGLAHRRRA
jgi:hypothetical protein